MPKQLITSDKAKTATHQHTKPCSDCPWARTALNGWLGGTSVQDWIKIAHSDTLVHCHTISNKQCAGLAIYRRNTCKRVEYPILTLPSDHKLVFSNLMQFKEHHEKLPEIKITLK